MIARPSRKIVFLFIVAVAVVGAVVWKKTADKKILASHPPLSSLNDDIDQDGLPEWKEILWQTDPKNPDTDGDGTKDGEEVYANRDPRKSAPNDGLATTTAARNSTSTPPTTTSLLGQEVLAGILVLNEEGLLNEATVKALVAETVARLATSTVPRYYNATDFTVGADTTAATRAYGNAVGAVFKAHVARQTTQKENELTLIYKATQEGNREALGRLLPFAVQQEDIVKKLLAITVPPSATGLHAGFVNQAAAMALSLRSIASFSDDPFAVILWFRAYRTQYELSPALGAAFRSYITGRGIHYESREGGAFFFQ